MIQYIEPMKLKGKPTSNPVLQMKVIFVLYRFPVCPLHSLPLVYVMVTCWPSTRGESVTDPTKQIAFTIEDLSSGKTSMLKQELV